MSEPNPPKTGGLWARLFGVQAETEEATGETPPQDKPAALAVAEATPAPPIPAEVAPPSNGTPEPIVVVEEAVVPPVEPPPLVEEVPIIAEAPAMQAPAAPQVCLACGAPRKAGHAFCDD